MVKNEKKSLILRKIKKKFFLNNLLIEYNTVVTYK